MIYSIIIVCRTNGLSDQRAVGPTGCRTNGLSDQRAVGPTGCRINGLPDQRAVGPTGCRTNGLSDQRAVGPMGCRTNGLSDQRADPELSLKLYLDIGTHEFVSDILDFIEPFKRCQKTKTSHFNFDLKNIAEWLKTNRLSLNVKKLNFWFSLSKYDKINSNTIAIKIQNVIYR